MACGLGEDRTIGSIVSIDNSRQIRGTVLSDRLDVRDPEGYSPLHPGLSGFLKFSLALAKRARPARSSIRRQQLLGELRSSRVPSGWEIVLEDGS